MLYQPLFATAGEKFEENTSSSSALGKPLWMAAQASEWGDSLNQCHRGDKRNTMVMMFVGGVVLMLDGILVPFVL
jgi:hypothetical protein